MTRKVAAVVDDDPMFQCLLERLLTRMGWITIKMSTGDNAHALVQRMRPALLIVNVGATYDAAWKLLDQVRLNPRLGSTAVVICSADTQVLEEKREAIQGLGWDVLVRPFELDDLFAKIDKAVGLPALRTAVAA
jgi:DNA-binding response OmpR family regulator